MNDALTLTSASATDDSRFDFAISPASLEGAGPGMVNPLSRPAAAPIGNGKVLLDNTRLRHLRQSRLLSQQDLADDCWRRNIRVSIATIKRAESGRAVRFRVAHELARCFDVPVTQILRF